MANLNFFLGDKGGIGKSFVCRTYVQYLRDKQHTFQLFDSDRTNPDLARIYADQCQLAIFSEGVDFNDSANAIYNFAAQQDVVVNCPAQVSPALNNWLKGNDIMTFAQEDNIRICYFFVTDGGLDSLKLLERSVNQWGQAIDHVVVKNWGVNHNWELFDSHQNLQKLIKQQQLPVLEFPMLHSVAQKIDQLSLTFGQARECKDFGLLTRNRVRAFLRKAYSEFDCILNTSLSTKN